MSDKLIIYQILPRLFTNSSANCVPNGTVEQNGVGKMNEITPTVLKRIKELGSTHIWFTGVIEHATKTDYSSYGIKRDNPFIVKGNAGSPYAIKDYYDIDPDLAESVPDRMKEFEALLKRTHKEGLGVIIDFVPNHVAREYHSDVKPNGIEDLGVGDDKFFHFNPRNNFYYTPNQLFSPSISLGEGEGAYYEFPAKATGNDCFSAFPSVNDWYETVKLNYGVDYGNNTTHFEPIPSTWFKMLHILRFWAAKGVDAFRCDMVHMVPVAFWRWAIVQVKEKYPNIKFIAELYDLNIYREYIFEGGFDYLYDKVNLYDTLRGIETGNISAATITNCWQSVNGIGGNMLNFLENHDEQRYASRFYAGDANSVLPSLVVSSTISTGPMMIYAGQELGERATDAEGFSGEDGRTTIFDYWSVPTLRRWYNGGKCNNDNLTASEVKLRETYTKVLSICSKEKSISEGAFFDLMYVNYDNVTLNAHRQYVYLRAYKDELLLIAVNFANEDVSLKVNIPTHAFQCLDFHDGDYLSVELLSDTKKDVKFSWETPFETNVAAKGAVIWKLKEKKKAKRKK